MKSSISRVSVLFRDLQFVFKIRGQLKKKTNVYQYIIFFYRPSTSEMNKSLLNVENRWFIFLSCFT